MYYNLAYILTSLFFLSFFFFFLSSVSLQLTWVASRQLPPYLFLFFSRSPLNSAFEIINARIFQRAVPTKVVFVFRSRRSKVTTCSITLFVLVDTLVSMKPLSATNVIDFLFSFSLLFFFFSRRPISNLVNTFCTTSCPCCAYHFQTNDETKNCRSWDCWLFDSNV